MPTIDLPATMDWTPEMLERLPEDFRYEVSEGRLIVSAAAMRAWHSLTSYRVTHLLRTQGREALQEQGVVVGPGELPQCDVGVLRDTPSGGTPSGRVAYHPAREFELVVEVVSPDSRRADRVVKPQQYAAGGIPEYWRVEETADGEAVVHQHRLVRTAGADHYSETRVVMLSTLEREAGGA